MIFARDNNALDMNPPTAVNNLTTHGSDFYWAFTALFALSAITFAVLSFRVAIKDRVFYHIFAVVMTITTISYFTMAADLGVTPIQSEFSQHQVDGTREIFYVRYINGFLTAPLVVLAPLLLTTLNTWQILAALFAVEANVVTRLIAALVQSQYKWGYFAMGIAAYIYVGHVLLGPGRLGAVSIGSDVGRPYIITSGIIVFIGFLYFLAFGLSEGGNVITVDSEAVFYGVLDLIGTLGVGVYFLWAVRAVGLDRLAWRESRESHLEKSAGPRASDATATIHPTTAPAPISV